MIYMFNILNDRGEQKKFYFTADSDNELYRRILRTYGVSKDRVTILEKLEETEDGYKKSKDTTNVQPKMSKKEQKIIDKSNELYHKAPRRCGEAKTDYMNKYGLSEIPIGSVNDLYDIVGKYKKVKVYWETTENRGEHKYYALVK